MESNLMKGSKIARMIWIVGTPVVFTVGVIGNIMTVLVLTHKSQKKSSTTVFLTVLAVADLLVMVVSLPRSWLIYLFGLDIRYFSNGACKIQWFITYLNSSVSTGILSAVTIERVLSTVMPHRTNRLCSVKFAYAISGMIVLSYTFFFLHIPINFSLFDLDIQVIEHVEKKTSNKTDTFFDTAMPVFDNFTNCWDSNRDCAGLTLNETTEENVMTEAVTRVVKMCWFKDTHYKNFYFGPFQVLNIIFYNVIPELIIFIGSIVIVRQLRASKTRIAPVRVGTQGIQQKKCGPDVYHRQITISLLLVNVVFVVCTTPAVVFLAGRSTWVDSEKGMTEVQEIAWAVSNILFFTNHAVNFVLYFLSGARFRKQVMMTCCIICSKKHRNDMQVLPGHVTVDRTNIGSRNATVEQRAE